MVIHALATNREHLTPWKVREDDFPKRGSLTDQVEYLPQYAVLAPSNHNTQPWRFRIRHDGIDLLADRTRHLSVSDPADRELTISCGAALYNFCLAAGHFGFSVDCRHLPDPEQPDLLASVDLTPGKAREQSADSAMFQAILRRHTNRLTLEDASLPDKLRQRFELIARRYGCSLSWCDDDERDELVHVLTSATREQMHDSEYRDELANWLHSDFSDAADGLPGYAVGNEGLPSVIAPWVVRSLDVGEGEAKKVRNLAWHAPALAVMGTMSDRPEEWLVAGEALSALLLMASTEGVQASFFSAPLELEPWRRVVADLTGIPAPQMIARFGYGPAGKSTPRRGVSEVTTDTESPA
jgi:hypothetical protein